jgi:subtilisin family serine protease
MSNLRIAAVAALAGAVAACSDTPSADLTAPPAGPPLAALLEQAGNPDRIEGQYVVVLKEGSNVATAAATLPGVEPLYVYESVLQGFAARLTPAQVAQLRSDPAVSYIAEDVMAYPAQEDVTPAIVQSSAVWNLARIDQARRLPTDGQYRYTATGAGVNVYVIDSGIRITHNEFDGLAPNRASLGRDLTLGNGEDCSGHGTHVAGIIAGTTLGVAKAARVVSVRVFGCTGGAPFSRIIAATEWVIKNRRRPAVVNISVAGSFFQPMNDAVDRLVSNLITTVVAAGGTATNACSVSPASAPAAITVTASSRTDARIASSNWGSCTDLYAPGEGIRSAWFTGDAAYSTESGTSTAAPHVAGMAALFLSREPTASPTMVSRVIIDDATPGIVTGFVSGQNRLLNRWNGSLHRARREVLKPIGHDCTTCISFTTAGGGYVRAWLAATPGTNFNLQLYRKFGPDWILVATQATPSTNETLTYYYHSPAEYRFRIRSVLNGGTFDLFVAKS